MAYQNVFSALIVSSWLSKIFTLAEGLVLYQLWREVVANIAHFKPSLQTIIVLCHFIIKISFICLTNKIFKSLGFKGIIFVLKAVVGLLKKVREKGFFSWERIPVCGSRSLLEHNRWGPFLFPSFLSSSVLYHTVFSVWPRSLCLKYKENSTFKTRTFL